MSFKRMLQTSMHVHQKDALNIHACASPDHYFVCLAFARSPKKIQVYQCLYVYIYIYIMFSWTCCFLFYIDVFHICLPTYPYIKPISSLSIMSSTWLQQSCLQSGHFLAVSIPWLYRYTYTNHEEYHRWTCHNCHKVKVSSVDSVAF